jgi:hypothetical protein
MFAVIFASFALALWIEANLTTDHDAAIAAFLFSTMALACWAVEWVVRWSPRQEE